MIDAWDSSMKTAENQAKVGQNFDVPLQLCCSKNFKIHL